MVDSLFRRDMLRGVLPTSGDVSSTTSTGTHYKGVEWHFRHIYRGQPKRHLLTSGWSTFVTAKKLVLGDACIFVRGEMESFVLAYAVRPKDKTMQQLLSFLAIACSMASLQVLSMPFLLEPCLPCIIALGPVLCHFQGLRIVKKKR